MLNGEQAHAYAYADEYIAMHLATTGDGKPYSYWWSTQARTEKDPTIKAADAARVDTLFRGETLRSMLNQAWAFGTVGTIAMYVGIGLLVASLLVTGTLLFELFFAPKRKEQAVHLSSMATSTR